jgi:hypothetical protein
MKDIQLTECKVRRRDCSKVIWKDIPIGLITVENNSAWRYSKDLKGEFWSLNEFTKKEDAVDELIVKRQQLDDFRLKMLAGE